MPDREDRMPILMHLEELRKRITYSVIALCAGFLICFNYSEDLLSWMMLPLNMTMNVKPQFPFFYTTYSGESFKLTFLELTEPFWMHMKIAFVAGIFLAMPVMLTQLWLFISPGLLAKEKKYALPFVASATAMFAIGALFCQYFVLPFAVKFLLAYKTQNLVQMITIGRYVDFVAKFMLAFGLIFELPLVITLLARLGLVTPQFLTKNRKYASLLAFVVAALITPTSDVFNLMLMAVPILVLYEAGIIMARLVGRKRELAAAKED